MRKTTIILFLIIQIALLFFFENIHSFMTVLAEKEAGMKTEHLLTSARYAVLKNGSDIEAVRSQGNFEFVSIVRGFRKEPLEETIGKERYLIFDVRSEGGTTLRFREKLDTPFSITLQKLTGFTSVFVILMGLFIILTGIYLIVRIKRAKGGEAPQSLPLFQEYITKLKESETTLQGMVDQQKANIQKSEEISRKVVNRINAAIILLNENNRIELFNPTAEKMFGKSSALALNNTAETVFSRFPEIIRFIGDRGTDPVSESVESRKAIYLIEFIPVTPSGKLLIIRDITEGKKREERLSNRKNFMMLGEMTAFLTHEVRNSLGVMLGYTKTMKNDTEKTDRIHSEIKFLTEMMENFLSFSKPLNMNKKERLDPVKLLRSICGESGLECEVTGETGEKLNSDPSLLKSVFSNLVLNSGDAGADKIKIRVLKSETGNLKLEIEDNGNGIKETDLEKVWYPFYTSKPKGTGMGLAIVKKIINFLDGEISILKSDSLGTTFSITFFSPHGKTDSGQKH